MWARILTQEHLHRSWHPVAFAAAVSSLHPGTVTVVVAAVDCAASLVFHGATSCRSLGVTVESAIALHGGVHSAADDGPVAVANVGVVELWKIRKKVVRIKIHSIDIVNRGKWMAYRKAHT